MKATTHGDHLVRVTRLGLVNCYLVREDDGLTLVDTTPAGAAKGILAEAERLGAPIVRVVLTHAHMDHAGSLDALAKRLPDAELLCSAREARILEGDRSLAPGEPQGKLRGIYTKSKARPTRLSSGDRVGSLEVHSAAGHTPGQIALLDTRDRTLICADSYTTAGGVATTARPNPRFPLPALSSWDRQTALTTAQELRDLEPSRLAPGHGDVVESPEAAMNAAIAAAAG